MKFIRGISDIFYPEYNICCICGEYLTKENDKLICGSCDKKLEYIKGHTCRICFLKIPEKTQSCSQCVKEERYVDKNVSVFHYKGFTKKMIHNYKYYNKSYLYRFFSIMMAEKIQEHFSCEFDCVTSVPLSRKKEVERGYNQAELIAKRIGKIRKIPYKKILKRRHSTVPQNKLGKIEREENLLDVFFSVSSKIRHKNILIVDDIYTTGATLNQCAKVLKKAGAENVFSVTIAR